jgi:hypothetical protein
MLISVELRPPRPDLSDGTVVLRTLRPADMQDVAAACRDPEIVRWTTLPGNDVSARVLAKAGFAREGLLRAYVNQRGELRDAVLWARLASDPH